MVFLKALSADGLNVAALVDPSDDWMDDALPHHHPGESLDNDDGDGDDDDDDDGDDDIDDDNGIRQW